MNAHEPINAIAVANYFVKKALESGEALTPMKLVKLVYIAHGWHLVYNNGQPLISEAAEAWQYGPVVPSVYKAFKQYGKEQIREMKSVANSDGNKFSYHYPVVDNEQTQQLLDEIWRVYGKFSGIELSSLTHQPETPWEITWNKNKGSEQKGAIIPNTLIREHYELLKSRNNGAAAHPHS